MTLFDGITARIIETPRLSVNILEREGDDPATPPERTVVLIHGNVSSSLFWQEVMLDLPARPPRHRHRPARLRRHRARARSTRPAACATSATTSPRPSRRSASPPRISSAGRMGGGVVMQYALDHPVLSLTLLVARLAVRVRRHPARRLAPDRRRRGHGRRRGEPRLRASGSIDHDTTDDAPTSPRSVFRSGYVARGYTTEHEDVWVESMLSTSTATGNYPGDSVPSENWPGFAAGDDRRAQHHGAEALQRVGHRRPRRTSPRSRGSTAPQDPIVSDTSFYDFNYLGQLGIVPGWPGADVAPPQEMVSQTRDVLDAYRAAGGDVTEVALEGVGHSAHLEAPRGVPPRAARGDRLRGHPGRSRAADRGDHPQVRGLTTSPDVIEAPAVARSAVAPTAASLDSFP